MGKKIKKDETKAANAAKGVTEQDYNVLLEKYQEATKRIELMSKDSDELVKEIASLKSSIGSYKSASTIARNKIKNLECYIKKTDIRLSALNEELKEMEKQRDAAIKDVNDVIQKNDALSKELTATRDGLATARKQIEIVSANNKDLSDEVCLLTSNVKWYNNLPWYVRMFKKMPMTNKK